MNVRLFLTFKLWHFMSAFDAALFLKLSFPKDSFRLLFLSFPSLDPLQ